MGKMFDGGTIDHGFRGGSARSKLAQQLDRQGQAPQIFLPRNHDRAQLPRHRRRHLYVKQGEFPLPQMSDQMTQGQLGSITLAMEHGFPGKQPARRHAVNPACQPPFPPALHAVRVACLVQPRIGLDEFGRYPRAFTTGSRRRATPYHLFKPAVHCDFKNAPPDHLVQTFRNPEAVQLKNRPRVRRPPTDRPDRPGKNPAAIRRQQPGHGQVTPHRYQSPRIRPARIRK